MGTNEQFNIISSICTTQNTRIVPAFKLNQHRPSLRAISKIVASTDKVFFVADYRRQLGESTNKREGVVDSYPIRMAHNRNTGRNQFTKDEKKINERESKFVRAKNILTIA